MTTTGTEQGIDVIQATVIANRLEAITRDMGTAMLRSARSPLFAENRDMATALFDHQGRMVAQAAYIPILLGSTPFAVEAVARFFAGDIHDGDVMIVNDPFSGNNHLPDVTVMRPIFYQGELRFWAVTRGHHSDLGGGGAGGYNPDAQTMYEEGLRITPNRLYRAGVYNREFWTMLLSNVRLAALVEGDLLCQVGATKIAERAVHTLLDRSGEATVAAAIEETLARSEAQVRAQVRAIPNGVYHAERRLDRVSRGTEPHPAVRLALRVEDDIITFDFTGTHEQIPTFDNGSYANTVASCLNAFFSSIDPDIKLNWGSTRPIQVVAPEGTLVNARVGAATTTCTTVLCAVIVECAWLALAQAAPAYAQGLWHRHGIANASSGINPRTGRPFAVIHFFGKGGSGATYGFDGWDHISSVASMGGSRSPDPEIFEMRSPHQILQYELQPESAGPGQWRGGHGVRYRVRFLADGTRMVLRPSCFSEVTAPLGVLGGESAPLASAAIHRASGETVSFDVSTLYRPAAGDVLDVYSTGGGGVGNPYQRAVEAVVADVAAGLLSPEHARAHYGVVLDPATLRLDETATAALRAERPSAQPPDGPASA